jgi:hypothetical protein
MIGENSAAPFLPVGSRNQESAQIGEMERSISEIVETLASLLYSTQTLNHFMVKQ